MFDRLNSLLKPDGADYTWGIYMIEDIYPGYIRWHGSNREPGGYYLKDDCRFHCVGVMSKSRFVHIIADMKSEYENDT